jgi:hypothetical protein
MQAIDENGVQLVQLEAAFFDNKQNKTKNKNETKQKIQGQTES